MDRNERFALFIRELSGAVPAATLEEARTLLETVLNRIEDIHSGADFDPSNWRNDGRLYPPQDDREINSGLDGVRTFRTVGHYVSFAANGAIRIVALRSAIDDIVLDKPGLDGERCPSMAS